MKNPTLVSALLASAAVALELAPREVGAALGYPIISALRSESSRLDTDLLVCAPMLLRTNALTTKNRTPRSSYLIPSAAMLSTQSHTISSGDAKKPSKKRSTTLRLSTLRTQA